MDDEVRVAANGRSEMGVFVGGEGEMAERLGGVAGLLQGAKHEVRKNALFGLAGDFCGEALVMLRANGDVAGWKRDVHGPQAAAPFAAGRTHAAMADGDAALGEIFHAEGVAEGVGELLEFQDFLGIGLFVNAMKRAIPRRSR